MPFKACTAAARAARLAACRLDPSSAGFPMLLHGGGGPRLGKIDLSQNYNSVIADMLPGLIRQSKSSIELTPMPARPVGASAFFNLPQVADS